MKRDFGKLRDGPFDLLVIGGGIYGASIANDASLRGLKVALVEKSDWGSGTSSASSKLIHGGLRYLEHLELGLVRKALRERRLLASLAPHRIRPLRFLIPVYRGDRVGRWRFKLGLWLYDRLAGSGQPVAPHRSLRRTELLREHPALEATGLRGGFTYGDCATDDSRMTLEVTWGAARAGAVAVNHAEAMLLRDGERVIGAVVRDELHGETTEVHAALTVGAAGAWSGHFHPVPVRTTKGVHLVLPALPDDHAYLLTAPSDGRVFFMIPWYGRTLVGTTDTDYQGSQDELEVSDEDVDYLLALANHFLGDRQWSAADILGSFSGLRVMRYHPDKSPSDLSRDWALEEPVQGLVIPVGGKLTSARADAAAAVDRIVEILGIPALERM